MSEDPAAQATPASAPLPVPASPAPQDTGSAAGGRPRGLARTLAALIGVLASLLYILNPGFGVFELLPDNLPGIGNLDEAGATAILLLGLRYLFKRPPPGP